MGEQGQRVREQPVAGARTRGGVVVVVVLVDVLALHAIVHRPST
jgi:hypothetical protein